VTLRVGVNAVFLEPGMGGLETYVLELIPALLEAEPSLRMTILANERGRDLLAGRPWSQSVAIETPAGSRRGARALYELGPLGLTASRRFDVLHSPALTAPLATRAANVVVLADTTWLSVPDMGKGQAATVRLWQAVVPHVARRADRVIAISEASARDVTERLGVPRERVDVIPLGYQAARRAEPTPEAELRERLGLGRGPLLLNVAVKKVHKNQMRIVEALPSVRSEVPDAQLVLAGASTPYEQDLRARAEALVVADAVTFPGYVSDADLEGLYAAAAAFVFPSLNEGFGLPLLEAMARGLPVVTSDRSALPEVAGDAALLVDPESSEQIAAATVRLLADAGLRARLVTAGVSRAHSFSWSQTARSTLETWRRAVLAPSLP
jgi:glycosyltransferase involved in cell wall biosynthesis